MIEEINSIKLKAAQPEKPKKKGGKKKAAKGTKKWATTFNHPLWQTRGATKMNEWVTQTRKQEQIFMVFCRNTMISWNTIPGILSLHLPCIFFS